MSEVSVKKISSRSKVALIFWVVATLAAATLLYLFLRPHSRAGLQVQTGEIAVNIILDGRPLGTSPFFNDQLEPGIYNLTLQPQDNLYLPFERKITLSEKFLTVVEWHPDTVPERAWGIFFEPQTAPPDQQSSSLEIASLPDNLVFKLDNTESQVTPQTLTDISPALHTLNFSLPSYESLTREVQVTPREKIKVFVKLAKAKDDLIQNKANADASGWDSDPAAIKLALDPTNQPIGATLKILPTKFYIDKKEVLSLRSKPDLNSDIVANLPVGTNLSYLGDESGAFYKVQYGQKTAWVEKKFVKFIK